MPDRLVDRLSKIRHGLFVGRVPEQSAFRMALRADHAAHADEPPFCVLHLCGPGGVGKSTLLREFALIAREEEHRPLLLDGRNIEPTPIAFTEALCQALGCGSPAELEERLGEPGSRLVLMLDTYELLGSLDTWLRESLLPQLPARSLMVFAGRGELAPAWHIDGGWSKLLRTVHLRNLSPSESNSYLSKRQVPSDQHAAILDFTHGHPLALSLVADLFAGESSYRFHPSETPDIVQVLLEHLVQRVPSATHRHALELCSLARTTTEPLLAAALCLDDAHELFNWLRGLSFMEGTRLGLMPHDSTREILVADLRWRDRAWYGELHNRARAFYTQRLPETSGAEQQRLLGDFVFLHRANPMVRPFFAWQESGNLIPMPAAAADHAAIQSMVSRHEGEDSARISAHWLERQPGGAVLLKDGRGGIEGFLFLVALHEASEAAIAADPAAAAAWAYLREHAPLRRGEGALLFRFWMARDSYQGVSSTQSLIFVNIVRHYLMTPGLAYSFLCCSDPDFWAPAFLYADTPRLPGADFQVGGRAYGVYGHDWRLVPPPRWLAMMGERETAEETSPGETPAAPPPLLVLSQPEFAQAVRCALRDLAGPDALGDNPLLRSRLIVERSPDGASAAARAAALQSVLRETAQSLQGSPRTEKFFRAVYHTYLHPAPTQERAATLLDLPFSTYRRHLKSGVELIARLLWQFEVGAK